MTAPFELPGELRPGSIIDIGDPTRLADFEDALAPLVEPDLQVVHGREPTQAERSAQELWAGRMPLQALIHPPSYRGKITGLKLTVMDEPYAMLLSARQRGWAMPGSGSLATKDTERQKQYKGFFITGVAPLNSRHTGHVATELWYAPALRDRHDKRRTGTGEALKRYIARSVLLGAEAYEAYVEESKRRAVDRQRYAIDHPYSAGLPGSNRD